MARVVIDPGTEVGGRVAARLRDELVVITGEAAVDESAPAAFEVPSYVEKYRDEIARRGADPESFSAEYSVAIRIRPTRLRHW
jgi:hypothetical protein